MGEEVEGALQDLGLTGNKIGNLGGPSPHHVSLFVVLVSFSNCDFYWWVPGYQNFTTRDAAAAVGLGLPVLPILPMRRHTHMQLGLLSACVGHPLTAVSRIG